MLIREIISQSARRMDTLNYNVTSFIGYVNNTVIKPPIYFNSHMRIGEQIKNIIPKGIHVFIQDLGTCKPKTARNVS